MNRELLLAHFDRISDAQDAIPRLRSFVLDLAVRGKLVEQNPKDEPADELLNRIQAEKARLVKEGKIGKQLPLSQIRGEDLPFAIPSGWSWVRLASISRRIHYGFTASANATLKGVRLLRITDIQNNLVEWPSVPGCEISEREVEQYKLHRGDILIARTGGTIGKTFLVSQIPVLAVFASYLIRIQKASELYDRYLKLFLESPAYWKQLEDGARGGGQPNVNGQTLGKMIVAVPPIAEQNRIVAKVDELMALCDRLEVQRTERESRRDRLTAASLHALNHESNVEDFRAHARFHLNHLPRLLTHIEHISEYRKTILNLAMRGKIVTQNPGDEPASELLKRIQLEMAHSKKASGAKERDNLRVGGSKDEQFEIPHTWLWVSLNQISFGFRYGTSVKCSYEEAGEPVLRIPNIVNGGIRVEDLKFGPLAKREADELRLRLGDILMVRSNGSLNLVGRAALVEANAVGYCYAGYLVRVRTSSTHLDPRYLTYALNSSYVRNQIEKPIRSTVGLKNVNATELRRLMISLPPLDEQHRIVAKITELMVFCDKLEAQLSNARIESRRLLGSVLHHALNDNHLEIEKSSAVLA